MIQPLGDLLKVFCALVSTYKKSIPYAWVNHLDTRGCLRYSSVYFPSWTEAGLTFWKRKHMSSQLPYSLFSSVVFRQSQGGLLNRAGLRHEPSRCSWTTQFQSNLSSGQGWRMLNLSNIWNFARFSHPPFFLEKELWIKGDLVLKSGWENTDIFWMCNFKWLART